MAKTLINGLENLKGNNLNNAYKSLSALMKDVSPDDINVPELDDATLRFALKNKLKAFERGSDQFKLTQEDKTRDPDDPRASPKETFIEKAKAPIADDSFMLHSVLVMNGYDAKFDGEYSEQELKDLSKISKSYEEGGSTLGNRSLVQEFRNSTAAEAEAEAKAQQDAKIAIEEQQGLIDKGLDILGYPPEQLTRAFTTAYQTSLQEESIEIFDTDELINIAEIDDWMQSDKSVAVKAVGYAISQGDYREQVAEMLQSGDKTQITKAQTILKLSGAEDIKVTGTYDSTTAIAAKDYIETSKGLSFEINHYRGGDLKIPSLENNINNGSIPIIAEILPQRLMALPEEMRNEHIAIHLSDPENFEEYSNHLKTKYGTDLSQKYSAQFDSDITELKTSEAAIQQHVDNRIDLTETANNAATNGKILEEEQIVLSDAVGGSAFEAIDVSLASYTVTSATPEDVAQLAELRENINGAELEARQYRLSPIALNEKRGLTVAVGASHPPITQELRNNITGAQNAYLDEFSSMNNGQRQNVLAHLDKSTQPALGAEPTQIADTGGIRGWVGNLIKSFSDANDTAETSNDAINTPTVKVSGLDLN